MRAGHEKKERKKEKKKKKKKKERKKKPASQCRGNAGILELKQTERDPAIFVSNPSLKKGERRKTDELLRVGGGIVDFVSRDEFVEAGRC